MRDWRPFVRQHFQGPQTPSDQALDELAQHVEETYRSALAGGRAEDEAIAIARAELENPPPRLPPNMIAPRTRTLAGWLAAGRDIRYAVRMLRSRPGFTAVAVITLALGIGANTAIFSVVRSLLLEPLPFPRPDQLMILWEADAQDVSRVRVLSAPNYSDFRRGVKAFAETGLWEYLSFNFSGDGGAERVPGLRTSASTFAMLGIAPELGRTFTAAEDTPGHDVAVISHRLWQRRFGGRPDIVGQLARINGRPFEIVGVMPASFRFPYANSGVWVPIALNHQDQGRGSHSFQAGVRLRDGVSMAAAAAELDGVARTLAKRFPDDNQGRTAVLTPMADLDVAQLRPTLVALSGAVALVLAIACANVANLLLAQASSRRQEFAIRGALGAGRARITAQVLAEALVIAVVGGAAGLGVAWSGAKMLAGVLPAGFLSAPFRNGGDAIHLDPVMLGFTCAVSLLTGVVFGLAPLVALNRNVGRGLKSGGAKGATAHLAGVRAFLVATEVALALVVLVAAGLMVKSLVRLVGNDPGLDPANVLVATLSLPQPDFYGPPVRRTFCADVTQRVGSLPGIISVGAISHLPLSGASAGRSFAIEGRPLPVSDNPSAAYRLTCPGYFRSLGIPIVRGRDFDSRDTTDAPLVAIVNERTADTYWPNQDPVGRRIKLGLSGSDSPWMTVVGVVGDVRHSGLDRAAACELFQPYSQLAWSVMTVVAKTATDPAGFAGTVRDTLQRLDPEDPVFRLTTMESVETASLGSRRFPMMLLAAFGGVALVLALVGVYGVVSYVVAQRTREIGIRVALGARRAAVLRLIVGGALGPVAAGLVVGLIGAVLAGRLLGTMLFDVRPGDPWVLAGIAAGLGTAALIACLIPAHRASTVDPISALRAD